LNSQSDVGKKDADDYLHLTKRRKDCDSVELLLDDGAFGLAFVAAVAFEADDAFLGLGNVKICRRAASIFFFVNAPKKVGFSWT